jgi:hypothetical protein
MGMEDHQEGEVDLREDMANPQVEVESQVVKDMQEVVEADLWLKEAQLCLSMFPS